MAGKIRPEVRSKIMAAIRGRDTKPELVIRRALHRSGFRYRLHDRSLPGSPDIVLAKWRAVVLVEGCFWHGHDCGTVRIPNSTFWQTKIRRNIERDAQTLDALLHAGWRVCRIWTCGIPNVEKFPDFIASLEEWLIFGDEFLELAKDPRGDNSVRSSSGI